jgi:GTPase
MTLFCQEPSEGNIEYKRNLEKFTRVKFEKYSTQLKYRIIEGNGKAIYIIGINDNGNVYGISKETISYTINLVNYISSNIDSYINYILKCKYLNKQFLIFSIVANFDISTLPFICN